jgi:two-component sensor histidine kinase
MGNTDPSLSATESADEIETRGPSDAAALTETRLALEIAQRELREERERLVLLRGELQHRVRNVLAVVRSIFSRSVAAGGASEEMADHFRGRLDVLARYQLTRTFEPGGSVDFETMVCDELQAALSASDSRIAVEGPAVRLWYDAAQLIGLAIHELATNSIKFGVLSSSADRARLSIRWRVTGDIMTITWRETGVAILALAPIRTGFGREFVEEALPYQLGAVTRFDLGPGQFSCTIALPLGEAGRKPRSL